MAIVEDGIEPPVPHPGRRLTEEEFESWCQQFEKIRAEWTDGDVWIMSPVNRSHLEINEILFLVLHGFNEARDLGKVHGGDFTHRFRAGDRLLRRIPDVWFLGRDRLDLMRPTYLDGPPDLAMEVVSPDGVDRDHGTEFADYQAGGVREYWIVDPLNETVAAWHLVEGVYVPIAPVEGRLASVVVPGFFLRPEWLWQQPLPRVAEILRQIHGEA